MSSLDNMMHAMIPFGMYSLNIGDLIVWELTSYAEEIDKLSDDVSEALRECFINTAVDIGLSSYERLYGAPHEEMSEQVRRQTIISTINIDDNDFTPSGVLGFFSSIGLECTIIEMPLIFDMTIMPEGGTYTESTREYIRKMAGEFLPCHLNFTIDFRSCNWDSYDMLENTFDEWDEMDMTWEEIDRYDV
ncbi:MAG: hypothetical protein IIZ59_01505 [Clostridia bacterium]|nr:hypothetical protein [Clostridia bacterium]